MHNLPYGFDIYLVNVKTIRQIAQIFVAFSEKLNFMYQNNLDGFPLIFRPSAVSIILINNELTVYNQGARFLHHQPAGRVHFRDGFLVPEPSDGWLGISGGLTGQNCYCVDGKGLIGRSHGYDRIFL